MAREARLQNPSHAIVATLEDQNKYNMPYYRRLDVVARPVDAYVSPSFKGASDLAEALGSSGLLGELKKAHGIQLDEQSALGAAKSAKDGLQGNPSENTQDKPHGFEYGYMKMQAILGAQKDSEALDKEWEQADKSQGVDAFIDQWWKRNGAGIQDPVYQQTYTDIITRKLGAFRQGVSNESVKEFVDNRNSSFRSLMHNTVVESSRSGTPIPMTVYEQMRSMGESMGITKAQSNALYFDMVKDMAQGVHDEEGLKILKDAASLFEQKHSDGTPGFDKYKLDGKALVASTEKRVFSELNAKEARERHERNVIKQEQADLLADELDLALSSGKNARALVDDPRFNALDDLKKRSLVLRAERVFKQWQSAGSQGVPFDAGARQALVAQIEQVKDDPEALRDLKMDARVTYQGKGAAQAINILFSDYNARNPYSGVAFKDATKDLALSYKSNQFFIGSELYGPALRQFKDAWEKTFYAQPEELYLAHSKIIPEEYKGRSFNNLPIPIQRQIGYAVADQFKQKTTTGTTGGLSTTARPVSPPGNTIPQKGEAIRLNNGVVVKRVDDK